MLFGKAKATAELKAYTEDIDGDGMDQERAEEVFGSEAEEEVELCGWFCQAFQQAKQAKQAVSNTDESALFTDVSTDVSSFGAL